jgi:hypothetical protein
MKKNKTLIKELRQDLHYHQMMVRVDLNAASVALCGVRDSGEEKRDANNYE